MKAKQTRNVVGIVKNAGSEEGTARKRESITNCPANKGCIGVKVKAR